MKIRYTVLLIFLYISVGFGQQAANRTFTNPLLPSGADPWSIYKDGYYYYTHTLGSRIDIWRTRNLADLPTAERKTVWTPPADGPHSRDLWAPEIHFIQGKWYIYFAADDGKNRNHRLWVLENGSADPFQGTFTMKGKLADSTDKWAIDGSVFDHKGQLYLVWSGWEGDENGRQDIYIAKMKNPWTIDGNRVLLSVPSIPWEKVGDIKRGPGSDEPPHVDVNEGPQLLAHGDKLFMIYSASGCWTDFYSLGMLTTSASSNLLDAASWTKSIRPVFTQSPQDSIFAPGHNSFFKSPDGTEDWILYHANAEPGQGCGGHRSPRAQKFTWNADGTPNFGKPISTKVTIMIPSEGNAYPKKTKVASKKGQ